LNFKKNSGGRGGERGRAGERGGKGGEPPNSHSWLRHCRQLFLVEFRKVVQRHTVVEEVEISMV